MGHVIRCLALADMLKNDFTIVFAIQTPAESVIKTIHSVTETILHLPLTEDYSQDEKNFTDFLEPSDIIILDGYNFKTDYQKAIKKRGCKLVVIDDLHSWHHVADIIINHASGANAKDYSSEKYTKLCLGLDYVLLRNAFLQKNSETKKITAVKKVFISMGAADINNITYKFTEAIATLKGIEEIHLMLGSINPHLHEIDLLIEQHKQIQIIKHFEISAEQLADVLKSCDLAICPASSISLECCAIGIGLISGYTAENQKGNLEGMEQLGILINLGAMKKLTIAEIISEFTHIFNAKNVFESMLEKQKTIIDGNSPLRLKQIFKNLNNAKQH
jgi:UDP-2,4-diacetamido-2,4,6-trideoxy-beta-L-altropyranose hydrolase